MAKMKEIQLADVKKVKQTKEIKKKIQQLYEEVAADLAEELKKIPKDANMSESMKKSWLKKYIAAIEGKIDKLEEEIYKECQVKMIIVADSVIKANIDFMKRMGLDLSGGFDKIAEEVVEDLIKKNVYKDWEFSKALWRQGKKVKDDMYTIVAKGVASQKPAYDIAKDLEKYVKPSAKKPWDWSKVYPGISKKIDYNAQRLARTLVQHAYQLSLRRSIAKNPFVTGVIWHSVFSIGRTCQVCMDRDGQRFKKGEEPLDHPNGLCWLEPEIPMTSEEIADILADWAHGGNYPEIDEYVKSAFGYNTAKYAKAKNSAKTAKPLKYKGKKVEPSKTYVSK